MYVIVSVAPAFSDTPLTVAVWLATATVPVLAVTWPAPAPVCGAVQPAGTSMLTAPLVIPPVGAVYVKVSVVAVFANVVSGVTVFVPVPSAALLTVTDGCAGDVGERAARRGLLLRRPVRGAGSRCGDPAGVRDGDGLSRVAREAVDGDRLADDGDRACTSVPTWPAPAPSCGAVQPAGTSIVTAPLVIPPVGAV